MSHQPIPACRLLNRSDPSAIERFVALAQRDADRARGRRLLCAACGRPITEEGAAAQYGGAHEHLFTNPAGIGFRIGCFHHAPGCTEAGPPTAEYTWFAGYRWRFALCGGCGAHLGWSYRGPHHFFGLILDRLRRDLE